MTAQQSSIWPQRWRPEHLAKMAKAERLVAGHPWSALDTSLARHAEVLTRATAANEFLDAKLGHLLIGACQAAVRSADQREALEQSWVRMTVAYLLSTDDCVHDLTALGGLDDDADVVLGLLEALGAANLAAPIKKHLHP